MEQRWRALAVLTAARTTMGFQFQSVASVSTELLRDLGLAYGELGLLIGLYFLPGVVVALPAGAAGRRFGDKRMVLLGLALMAAGGAITGLASSLAGVAAGRVLSGVGAVLLNVVMSKMVTDWFAGRELALAMSVFVNSFPIGIGLALLVSGAVAASAGWQGWMMAAASLPLAALLLLGPLYQRHPNDGGAAGPAAGAGLGRSQVLLVCVAGAIWGLYNGAFAVMIAFAPIALAAAGVSREWAGTIVAFATWAIVGTIQPGGLLAHKWDRPGLLLSIGVGGWALCMLLAALVPPAAAPSILGGALLMGLPVGVILSLPAQVLSPAQRSVGMGLFYLWLYIGHGLLPPAAGWLRDALGGAGTPLMFAAGLGAAMLVLHAAFTRRVRSGTAAPASALQPRS